MKAADNAPARCSHTGSQMCERCAWSRPRQAVVLVVRGRTAGKALPVALVMGTVLSAVNQGSVIFAGQATAATWAKVVVNFAVPFLVASIGYLSGRRIHAEPEPSATQWRTYLSDFHDTPT